MKYALLLLAVIASTCLGARAPEIIPGDIIVPLAPGVDANTIVTDCAELDGQPTGLRVVRELSKPMRAWLLHHEVSDDLTSPSVMNHEAVVSLVRSQPGITIAQSNQVVKERNVPNDPLYGSVWHHDNIDSEAAWDITTGGITAVGCTDGCDFGETEDYCVDMVNNINTAIEESLTSEQLQVFPNPSNNQFTIILGSNNKNEEVYIFDITGKSIYTHTVTDKLQLEANTADFTDGVYVVQIQSADFVATKKLVVKKQRFPCLLMNFSGK